MHWWSWAGRTLDLVASGCFVWAVIGATGFFTLSRRRRPLSPDRPKGLDYIFVIPALNEGRVIADTVRHLLTFPIRTLIVVDDASDDDTAEELARVEDSRLVVLRRTLPDARLGKGAALNEAYRWLRRRPVAHRPADRTIVAVLDADGRLSRHALHEISPHFADPQVGACQIGVRIRNRHDSFWTRMQHFEFVAFTALYQRGRQWTGAVGLGGNGQFVRFQALLSLGDDPWSACLTEDLELGIRLLERGWRNNYVSTTSVTQQALPDMKRLVRQRTRWFQGAMQCVGRLPAILGSTSMGVPAKVDLVSALLSPVMLVIASPFVLTHWTMWGLGVAHIAFIGGTAQVLVIGYLFAFLPGLLLAWVYWLDEPETGLIRSLLIGHVFTAYGYIWLIAGWRAIGRQVFGRKGWLKTSRMHEERIAAVWSHA